MDNWSFYIIKNGNATYAGVSPDPIQRLRKHNGELQVVQNMPFTWSRLGTYMFIHGFRNKIESMQFEG